MDQAVPGVEKQAGDLQLLKKQVLHFSFFNFFLVALSGLFLRSYPFLSAPFFDFRNMVHGHSHFAFGGWVMPILIWMILQYFPVLAAKVAWHHWRNIAIITLVSAYGMLASFPFQGYALVSICFSTLSIMGSFYLAIVLIKAMRDEENITSLRFLRAGLIYGALSAIGPFATGPLIAKGMSGTPLFFDSIYLFLHFQYNGWFTFAVLSVAYAVWETKAAPHYGIRVFLLFNLACLPAYFLSVLWHHPPFIFYWIGGMGALLQLAGILFMLKDFFPLQGSNSFLRWMVWFAFFCFVLKNILQLLSAFPQVAEMAYQERNFIIAYLHLVLLGFISLSAIISLLNTDPELTLRCKKPVLLFLLAFLLTESLLLIQAALAVGNLPFSQFYLFIFLASILLPVSVFWLWREVKRRLQAESYKLQAGRKQ
jgi:hypothetical protein